MQCCCGKVRVVTKNDDPAMLDNALYPFSLGFERLQRIKVIGHDPGKRKMMACGKQVGDEDQGSAAPGDFDCLDVGVVPRNADDGNARQYFGVAGDRFPLLRLLHRKEVVLEIACAIAFGGVRGVNQLARLDNVAGISKSWDDLVAA